MRVTGRVLLGAAMLALVVGMAPVTGAMAETKTAAAPAEKRVVAWDLTPIYPTPDAWEKARQDLLAELVEIEKLQGTLGRDAASFRTALDRLSAARQTFFRLNVYAGLSADQDLRVPEAQARRNAMTGMQATFGKATSWVNPEIQSIGAEKVRAFLDQDKGLARHRFDVEEVLRNAAHILTPEAEKVAAALTPLATGGSRTMQALMSADIPWPTVELPGREKIRADATGYRQAMNSPDRELRAAVFKAYMEAVATYSDTLGQLYGDRVNAAASIAKLRNHEGSLSMALSSDNIPKEVFTTLVAEANKGMGTLHRSYTMRRKLLALEELYPWDLSAPLVSTPRVYSYEDALTLAAVSAAPLGQGYQRELEAGLKGPWAHVFPAEGKRAGAYQWGAYGVHPYVLLNFTNDFDSVSTLVHEWGHAMHSKLAQESQPFETAGYPLFLAEIAAFTNELLLADHMLAKAKTREEKLFYLGQTLDQMRGSFFVQTMFSEFEMEAHAMADRGEPLTAARMTELYGRIQDKYIGKDQGIVKADGLNNITWSRIPHFYRPFYVYQYATSMAAAAYFVDRITAGEKGAVDQYLSVLRAGGSDHPHDILKAAGLDLSKPEPYRALLARMERIMDEIEKVLNEPA